MNAIDGDDKLVPDPRAVEARELRQPTHRDGRQDSHLFWYEAGYEAGRQAGRKAGIVYGGTAVVLALIVWTALDWLW